MKNNNSWIALIGCLLLSVNMYAQYDVPHAFDDAHRAGVLEEEQRLSEMYASSEALTRFLEQNEDVQWFCFTEDRMHDIHLKHTLPIRWLDRTEEERTHFKGNACPGEYYTWQIGLYAPYAPLQKVSFTFSDLKNEYGDKIKAASCSCLNTDGCDTDGQMFHRPLRVPEAELQPCWIGIQVPVDARGSYEGKVVVNANGKKRTLTYTLDVNGHVLTDEGIGEEWSKSRLCWLNGNDGLADTLTRPYIPLHVHKKSLTWLGGTIVLAPTGLPSHITTCYDANNNLSDAANEVLAGAMQMVIETEEGEEVLKNGRLRFTRKSDAEVAWQVKQHNARFEVLCRGTLGFDGIADMSMQVRAKDDVHVQDIRLQVPYEENASTYLMGLGHKGGIRPDRTIRWKWNADRFQDKVWMGAVNAGLNLSFRDEHANRSLKNVYYSSEKQALPLSWANNGKGGIRIHATAGQVTLLAAYSGERTMQKGESLCYNFTFQVTPVKPLNWQAQADRHYYYSDSEYSTSCVEETEHQHANIINVYHKRDIYPYVNYPLCSQSVPALKHFIGQAHEHGIKVQLYYNPRELNVKMPELWALHSMDNDVLYGGTGGQNRSLVYYDAPNKWLIKHIHKDDVPAWYSTFQSGEYAAMDVSVMTAPNSRWNNYYLSGLRWMVDRLDVDGINMGDCALDRPTLRRVRRILDKDGEQRKLNVHLWNQMNPWFGYTNALHQYMESLPYIDCISVGDDFDEDCSLDEWLIEMSGIPFGMIGETLTAQNVFRSLTLGMLPHASWRSNPTPWWNLCRDFGIQEADMLGFWDSSCPVRTDNELLPTTVYAKGNKALVVIANWSRSMQKANIRINAEELGFTPKRIVIPEIHNVQNEKVVSRIDRCEIAGGKGLILILEM